MLRKHVWILALCAVASCGGSDDTDERSATPAPVQIETPDHLLFARPLDLADIALPSPDSSLARLVENDEIWLAVESYPTGQFNQQAPTKGVRYRGMLWRARPKVTPTFAGIRGPAEAVGAADVRERVERLEEQADLTTLEIGEALIDERGIYFVRERGEGPPPDQRVTYPVPTSAVLSDLMSPVPAVGDTVAAAELLVRNDTRRSLKLSTPGSIGWALRPEDGGGRVRFGYALRKRTILPVDETAICLLRETKRSAKFSVALRGPDGEETVLWSKTVPARAAGGIRDGVIDGLPQDVEGSTLVFRVEPEGEADPDGLLHTVWCEPSVRRPVEDPPPNVLVILLDTLRADRLGCYGYDRPTSPNLDALAERGVVYSDVWSCAPWTLPSHASLFSSLYMSEHGVWDRRFRLSDDAVTMAEVLRGQGYETGAFTQSGYVRPEYGFAQGFDRFWFFAKDTEKTFSTAADWIEGSTGPYFAFVHTYHVHSPHDPEGEARSLLVRDYDGDLPTDVHTPDYPWGHRRGDALPQRDVRYISDLYDAEIRELDAMVGDLLARLEASGRLDDTIVIVTSDHGEEFADHAHFEHGWSLYQEQLFVPLIVHYPGVFDGGRVVDHPVIGLDIAPTVAQIAGAEIPEVWSGAPLGLEPPESDRPIWVPYRTRDTGNPATALRRGPEKYIDFPMGIRPLDGSGQPGVYDLSSDPGELENLWDADGTDRKRWSRAVRALQGAYPLRHDSTAASTGEDVAATLKALGYGGGD